MNIGIKLIVDEAKSRGIKVDWIIKPSCYSMTYKGRTEYFFSRYWSGQGLLPYKICKHKDRFKKMMVKNGLPASQGLGFKFDEFEKALVFVRKIGWPVVLKPHAESQGRGVCLMINDEKMFQKRWKELSGTSKVIMVEKMYFGQEYRIFVTDKKIISVLERIPANVTGDGVHTIGELIGIKDIDKIRNRCKSMDKIVNDDAVLRKLKESSYDLESIPKDGEYIRLRYASNLSLGGDSEDATDKIHPSVSKIAISAVRAIPGLRYGGMDYMTEDITVDQKQVSHAIIEMNKAPEIDANHFPLLGKPRDCAGAIIDLAFPETITK